MSNTALIDLLMRMPSMYMPTFGSASNAVSFMPMPRIVIDMFELDDGCFWMVTLGEKSAICDALVMPMSVILSAVNAVIAIGVSCSDSSRRWAVTTISSSPPARGDSWAVTGTDAPAAAVIAMASAEARHMNAFRGSDMNASP
jgi:hypothetical protein